MSRKLINAAPTMPKVSIALASASLFFWVMTAGVGRPSMALALVLTVALVIANFASKEQHKFNLDIPIWFVLTVLAVLQYFVFFGAIAYMSPPPSSATFIQKADEVQFWAIGATLLLLVLSGWRSLTPVAHWIVPPLIAGASLVLVIMILHRVFPEPATACRVTGPSNNYFFPAFVLGVLSVLSLSPDYKVPLWAQVGLLFGAILIMTFVSGTRMIFLAYLMCLSLIVLVQLLAKLISLKHAGLLFVTLILSLSAGLGFDLLTGCDMMPRLMALLIDTRSSILNEVDPPELSGSVNVRIELLKAGWEFGRQAPWTGHGMYSEHAISRAVQPGLTMVHNQYLSWFIWAGIPGLVSGLIFLLAPLCLFLSKQNKWHVATICTAICGVSGLSMISDTLLRTDYFVIMQVVTVALIASAGLTAERNLSAKSPA